MAIPDNIVNMHIEYKTWDTFKRDLETKLGRWLTVDLWIRTKPKKSLPWNDGDMQICLLEVLKIRQEYDRDSRM